jgi:hypothetical protein
MRVDSNAMIAALDRFKPQVVLAPLERALSRH